MLVTVSVGSKSYNYSTSLDTVENGDGIALKERQRKPPPILMRSSNNSSPLSFRRKQNGFDSGKEKLYNTSQRKSNNNNNSLVGCHWLDTYCRLLFPLAYVIFLVVYFVYYTNAYEERQN